MEYYFDTDAKSWSGIFKEQKYVKKYSNNSESMRHHVTFRTDTNYIMAQTTFVNSRGVVHAGSGGMSAVFPDVCKTPSPGGPIPIPYPNIGKSADTSKGPQKVKVDGKMPMVKGAQYMVTTGDEAGTAGGGVLSNSIKGAAEFMMYSFDVKFEGKNVCRLGDPLFHNKKNIMG